MIYSDQVSHYSFTGMIDSDQVNQNSYTVKNDSKQVIQVIPFLLSLTQTRSARSDILS